MTWTITAVPPEGVKDLWPRVAPLLAPAVKRSGGRVTMATLFSGLQNMNMLLWVVYQPDKVIRTALVTHQASYPARRMLSVDFVGGTQMRGWVGKVNEAFLAYAVDAGLDGVEMAGRDGWLRVLEPYGWKRGFVVMDIDASRLEVD